MNDREEKVLLSDSELIETKLSNLYTKIMDTFSYSERSLPEVQQITEKLRQLAFTKNEANYVAIHLKNRSLAIQTHDNEALPYLNSDADQAIKDFLTMCEKTKQTVDQIEKLLKAINNK